MTHELTHAIYGISEHDVHFYEAQLDIEVALSDVLNSMVQVSEIMTVESDTDSFNLPRLKKNSVIELGLKEKDKVLITIQKVSDAKIQFVKEPVEAKRVLKEKPGGVAVTTGEPDEDTEGDDTGNA